MNTDITTSEVKITVTCETALLPIDTYSMRINVDEEWAIFEHPNGSFEAPYDAEASPLYHLLLALQIFVGKEEDYEL